MIQGERQKSLATPQRAAQIKRPALARLVVVDLAAVIIALIACLLLNPAWLLPLLLGFSVFLIPNLFFIWRAFRYMGAKYARQVARSLYIAELGKFMLTLSLLAWIFLMLPPQHYLVMFAAYFALWAVHQLVAFTIRQPVK